MRTKKRLVSAVAVFAVLGLVAGACGGDDGGTDETDAPSTDAPSTDAPSTDAPSTDAPSTDAPSTDAPGDGAAVGLLFDVTGRGDKSFNDAAAAGLDQAVAEFGVVPSESTPTGEGDRAERLAGLIDAGNGLVIGVGFLWGDAITAGSAENPETSFAIIDSVVEADNVASLVFAEHEGSFLVGAAAALKSQTGKVGFIGGVENDLIKRFEAGFAAGVAAVDPEIEVLVQYISQPPDFTGFNDSAKGKEIAAAMYADGADVVYSAAGASGLGAFQAAQEAAVPGEVWAIGVDSDQYNLVEPDLQPYILTSMLKKVDVAVYQTVKAYAEGTFAAGVTTFDLAADGVGYSTSGGFVDDIADQLDEYAAQIIDGTIEVPTAP